MFDEEKPGFKNIEELLSEAFEGAVPDPTNQEYKFVFNRRHIGGSGQDFWELYCTLEGKEEQLVIFKGSIRSLLDGAVKVMAELKEKGFETEMQSTKEPPGNPRIVDEGFSPGR